MLRLPAPQVGRVGMGSLSCLLACPAIRGPAYSLAHLSLCPPSASSCALPSSAPASASPLASPLCLCTLKGGSCRPCSFTRRRSPLASPLVPFLLPSGLPAPSPSPSRSFPFRAAASQTDSSGTTQSPRGAETGADGAGAGAHRQEADNGSAAGEEVGGAEKGGGGAEGEEGVAPLRGWGRAAASVKMALAPPWQRVKKGSVLSLRLYGQVSEQPVGFVSSALTVPKLIENLRKAAVDPRIAALLVKIEPLSVGWGKLEEIRRHIALFRQSGKPCVAFMAVVGETEYYLATAFDHIFVPPSAYVSLRGLAVQGQFFRGVLEKAGVQPQVERIGKYKSAGDSFARKDMSEPNREMLNALLDDIYRNWVAAIAASLGKSVDEVKGLLEQGLVRAGDLLEQGLVSGLKYESEVESMLKEKIQQPDKDKPLRAVDYRKYSRVSKWTLNMAGAGDATIAVIRAAGGISQGRDRGMGGQVKSDSLIEKIRFVKDNKAFKALVLRIDSPGGDALASDLMWHEIRQLAAVKPVVASMSDLAASGGYYMAMAAPTIVAEPLTLTGSIGVVLAKLNLGELYGRIGFNKEIISRGKYSQLNADNRPFTPEEEEFFAKGARLAYEEFRNKAAQSRGMEVDAMEAVAQGRVWTGRQALERGLVDALGGMSQALAIAKDKAGIPPHKQVRTVELSTVAPSLSLFLSGMSSIGLQHWADAIQLALSLSHAASAPPPFSSHSATMPDIHIVGSSTPPDWGHSLHDSSQALQHPLLTLLRTLLDPRLTR